MSIEIFEKSKICQICGEQNPIDSHYHKIHRLPIKDYFIKYFPKNNLLTNELIIFKDKESYIQNSFNDKNELRAWMKDNDKDIVLEYLINWLKIRKEIKGLEYAFGQFYARSLLFPSVSYLIKNYGVYSCWERINSGVGLKTIYDYSNKLEIDNEKELNFIVDTREQNHLNLSKIQIKKLNVGDYAIDDINNRIFIERKSLNDFLGTMSAGFERFDRELQRAQDSNSYLIILIEEKYANLSSYPFLPHMKSVKATPSFIASRFRSLIQKYPLNCQFLAVDGRKEAVRVIEKIYRVKDVKNYDLQWLYDLGNL